MWISSSGSLSRQPLSPNIGSQANTTDPAADSSPELVRIRGVRTCSAAVLTSGPPILATIEHG
jgi:hypothetical protein